MRRIPENPSIKNRCLIGVKGFTLLELMVVVTIIAVLSAMLLPGLVFKNEKRELQREVKRLEFVLTQAVDESFFLNQDMGFLLEDNQYQFYRFNPSTLMFEAIRDDERFSPHQLPEAISIELATAVLDYELVSAERLQEQQNVISGEAPTGNPPGDSGSDTSEPVIPPVWFLASGESTPFEMRLALIAEPDYFYRLSISQTGELAVEFSQDMP